MYKYISIILILFFNVLKGNPNEYVSEIQSYIDTGQYDKANEKLLSAIKKYDANARLYFLGGQVAIKLDKFDEANKYIIKSIIWS